MKGEDRRAPSDLIVSQDARERLELFRSELSRGDERQARDRAGHADEGKRPAKLHDRKATERDVCCQVRQVALEVGREETSESSRTHRTTCVEVVVTRDDRDVLRIDAELLLDESAHPFELL